MTKELTAKQVTILRYVQDQIEERGFPPSIREIGNRFDISSLRGVTVHLDSLERKGCIERGNLPRSIRITPLGKQRIGLPKDPRVAAAAAIIRRLRHEANRHSDLAEEAEATPGKPATIRRLRYTAQILETLATEFEARYLLPQDQDPEPTR